MTGKDCRYYVKGGKCASNDAPEPGRSRCVYSKCLVFDESAPKGTSREQNREVYYKALERINGDIARLKTRRDSLELEAMRRLGLEDYPAFENDYHKWQYSIK